MIKRCSDLISYMSFCCLLYVSLYINEFSKIIYMVDNCMIDVVFG